jgi:arsenate reductase (thioredoxin)
MAERIFNRLAAGRHSATSAGSEPGEAAHPVVVEALSEIGLDAADHLPRKLEMDEVGTVDAVVSTCGQEACPVTPPDVKRIYWNLPDPKHLPIEQVRPLRDEIQACVEQLIAQLDNEARAA